MMNKYDSVPKLNLEPKLKRPLSLWNPLDYLRLLYWVFFFPQAIQWYVDKFNNKSTVVEVDGWRDRFKLLHQQLIPYQLFVQGFVLIAFLLLIPTYQLSTTNFLNTDKQTSIAEQKQLNQRPAIKIEPYDYDINNWERLELYNYLYPEQPSFSEKVEIAYSSRSKPWQWWLFVVCYSMWVAIHIFILKPWKGIPFGLTFAILLGIQLCVFLWIGYITHLSQIKESYFLHIIHISKASLEIALDSDILLSLFMGIVMGIIINISCALHRIVDTEGTVASLVFILSLVLVGLFTDNLWFCITYLFSFYLFCIRVESWFISLLCNLKIRFSESWQFSRITPLPLPFVSSNLNTWLERDWNTGIYNANQIVKYTLQFIPVSKTINRVLATTPDAHLIYRVNQLAENPFDWKLIHFASAPLNKKVLGKNIRIDTPARATAAGFWYLHEQQPNKAAEAFAKVRTLLYGEEIYTLAETLAIFKSAKELEQIASLDLPAFPQDNLLRGSTWETLNKLRRVVIEIKTIETSVSHATKALALNRAIGELTAILDTPETLLEAEKELIIEIAQNWKRSLERIARDIGNICVTKPVANPYVIGDPVQGSLFAGREDIMQQLEELWSGDRLQSVVLFGHRRMGKTSILLNIDRYIDADIKIAYINLLRLGDSSQGVGEVLMQICDGIAEVTGILPPDDDALLKLPYRTFERYIKQIEQAENSLIIAIDEFEKIEELIELQRIPTDFLGFLRGIVQMNSRIALIFAGLHTLEEMTADYFQPFFASVIPLHVGFLNAASTRQILANPTDTVSAGSSEFMLDYTLTAFDLIYTLTAGQPYLIQLIGFQLVRRYNQQMFERGIVCNPRFTEEDVTAIANREFFQRGRYYFEGIWGQAAQDIEGQQEIIKALAPYPQGLPEAELITQIQIDDTTARNAIAILQRHDVIRQTGTGWQIIVELFRRWVNLGSR